MTNDANDTMEDESVKDEIVNIFDVLYFEDTPASEIKAVEDSLKKTYSEVTIEDASDGIHGARRAVKIGQTSAIGYLKNLLLIDCEGRSLYFQHGLRAGRPWTDRVIEALRMAKAERPDMFDKER